MKYIKTYESTFWKGNVIPLGEYVVFEYPDYVKQAYVVTNLTNEDREFINNNVGEVIPSYISEEREKQIWSNIKFENAIDSSSFYRGTIILQNKYIIFRSKNREECEAYLQSKKYNL